MFVRRTKTRQTDGASYHTHRLVRSERDGRRVRQRTLLNLGRHFDIDRERWPPLCQRVEAALAGQTDLFDDVPADVERAGGRRSRRRNRAVRAPNTGPARTAPAPPAPTGRRRR